MKEKKNIIIIIVAIIVFLLCSIIACIILFNRKKTIVNKDFTAIPIEEIKVDRNGKNIELYYCDIKNMDGSSDLFIMDTLLFDECSPFNITCESQDCEFAVSSEKTNYNKPDFMLVKDGNYYSIFDRNNRLLAREIGKDLIDQGKTLYPSKDSFGITTSGYLFAGFTIDTDAQGDVIIYNATTKTQSDIIKNTDLHCGGDEENGCNSQLRYFTDYQVLSYNSGNKYQLYNISNGKIDLELDINPFVIGTREKYYFASNNKIYDNKGKLLRDNLTAVKQQDDNIYIYADNKIQKVNNNLKTEKEVSNVNNFYMTGKNFVLVYMDNQLKLLNSNFDVEKELIHNFNENDYRVNISTSGNLTYNNKEGIWISVSVLNADMKNQLRSEHPELTSEEIGYYFYYNKDANEFDKVYSNMD